LIRSHRCGIICSPPSDPNDRSNRRSITVDDGEDRLVQRPGRVVELFAGVGGFRLGLERTFGGFTSDDGFRWEVDEGRAWEVVWANQWEPSARSQPAADNYAENLRLEGRDPSELVNEDIARVLDAELGVDGGAPLAPGEYGFPEEFELLVGGFPCQDYSVAKPLSQSDGIDGKKGVLWWEIHRILEHRRPPYVLLENVDRLLKSPSTQRGRDFAVMLACLARLGYRVEWRVVNAADHGFPQRRRRIFLFATTEEDGLHLEERSGDRDPAATAGAWGRDVIASSGVLAAALPCALKEPGELVSLGDVDPDPYDVSEAFGFDERGRPAKLSPFRNAGVMSRGVVWTADVEVDETTVDERWTLGDVLQPLDEVLEQHREVVIPPHQLDFSGDPARSTWNYLKGSKREERIKPGGFTYYYTEGAVGFPEPLEKAARTVLTGEGGTSPSRFKLVVKQELDDEQLLADLDELTREAVLSSDDGPGFSVYRRLTPIELERLDMFPDRWTESVGGGGVMSPGRRAFCVGNALVVGVVHRIGTELARRCSESARTLERERLRAV
jgi:DNA (cytosine-5)-methyltransferase 1